MFQLCPELACVLNEARSFKEYVSNMASENKPHLKYLKTAAVGRNSSRLFIEKSYTRPEWVTLRLCNSSVRMDIQHRPTLVLCRSDEKHQRGSSAHRIMVPDANRKSIECERRAHENSIMWGCLQACSYIWSQSVSLVATELRYQRYERLNFHNQTNERLPKQSPYSASKPVAGRQRTLAWEGRGEFVWCSSCEWRGRLQWNGHQGKKGWMQVKSGEADSLWWCPSSFSLQRRMQPINRRFILLKSKKLSFRGVVGRLAVWSGQ